MTNVPSSIPIIDVSPLINNIGDKKSVATALHHACTEFGFFYIVGHDIDEQLQIDLEKLSQQFFFQNTDFKKLKNTLCSSPHNYMSFYYDNLLSIYKLK